MPNHYYRVLYLKLEGVNQAYCLVNEYHKEDTEPAMARCGRATALCGAREHGAFGYKSGEKI